MAIQSPKVEQTSRACFGLNAASEPQDMGSAAWATNETQAGSGLEPLRVLDPKEPEQVFQQVPFSSVQQDWRVVGRYKWKRAEPIPVLESRASRFAVKHALRNASSFGQRHLVLSDSISAVCSLDRGNVAQSSLHVLRLWISIVWMIHRFLIVEPGRNQTPKKKTAKDLQSDLLKKKAGRKKQLERVGSLARASVGQRCRSAYSECWSRLLTFVGRPIDRNTPAAAVDYSGSKRC